MPAASAAVTVMTLTPLCRVIPDTDHDVVPIAVPLPPPLLDHVTRVTPTVSEAVPAMLSGLEFVEYVALAVGEVIAMMGGIVSPEFRHETEILVTLVPLMLPDPLATEQV